MGTIAQQILGYFRSQTQQALQAYDLNRDGYIAQNEMAQLLQQSGYDANTAAQFTNTVFTQLDADRNGYITIQDFQRHVNRRTRRQSPRGNWSAMENLPELQQLKQVKTDLTQLGAVPYDTLGNLEKKLVEIGNSIRSEANMLHSSGNTQMGSKYETAANIATIAGTVAGSMNKFQSNDPAKIASGVLDLVGSVGGMAPPPYGTATSAVCSLASFICSMFAEAEPSPQQKMLMAIGKVVEAKLSDMEDARIRAQINGNLQQLQASISNIYHQSLNPVLGHITSYHIEQQNISFLGELSSYINNKLKTDRNITDKTTHTRTLNWIYSYCLISTLKCAEIKALDFAYFAALKGETQNQQLTGGLVDDLNRMGKTALGNLNAYTSPNLYGVAVEIKYKTKGGYDYLDPVLTLDQYNFIKQMQQYCGCTQTLT